MNDYMIIKIRNPLIIIKIVNLCIKSFKFWLFDTKWKRKYLTKRKILSILKDEKTLFETRYWGTYMIAIFYKKVELSKIVDRLEYNGITITDAQYTSGCAYIYMVDVR